MPFVKDWINFVYEESLVSEALRLKPRPRVNSSPLVKTSGNMGNRDNKGCSRDKRLHGWRDKMLALSGIESGFCSLKGSSNLRFRIC